MKYIFFDIECANCFGGSGKMCEFGYVITDEQFRILEKNLYWINPNAPFDWYVQKNMLAYSAEEYRFSDAYPIVFPKIKRLFDLPDTMIVGHTVDADAGYLNDEARRYDLPFFNYTFYDVKEMYTAYANTSRSISLEQIGEELGSDGPEHAHRSVDDAQATANTVRAMCSSLGVSFSDLVSLCPDAIGKTENGIVWTPVRERAEAKRKEAFEAMIRENRIEKRAAKLFTRFRNAVRINVRSRSALFGMKICFSRNYEDDHLKEMMFLVRKIADLGAECIGKATACDFFVRYDVIDKNGETKYCPRLSAVEVANASGKNIRICSLDEMLKMIKLTEKDLENAPAPTEEDFREKEQIFGEDRLSTVGELLEAAGVDLLTAVK